MPSLKPPTAIPILFLVLLFTQTFQVEAISIAQCRTLISLAHSLMSRVADLRSSRGDYEGAQRARQLASKLEGVLGLWEGIWSVGWDNMRNYACRDMTSPSEMFATVSDQNQLLKTLNELTQLKSGKETTDWAVRNYKSVFSVFATVSDQNQLLKALNELTQLKSGKVATVSDLSRLLKALNELTQLKSGKETTDWAVRNYQSVFSAFATVSDLNRLLKALNELTQLKSVKETTDWAVRNYKSVFSVVATISDLKALNELTQLKSRKETTDWVVRNYKNAFSGFKSLGLSLLKGFYQPGPLRDLALEIQKGDLLRDCIEIGSNDLKGLVKIIKDLAVQSSSTRSNHGSGDLSRDMMIFG